MLIPPFFMDCVVALGHLQAQQLIGAPPTPEWATTGTGFFYGSLIALHEDPGQRQYRTFLVTARHVVQQHIESETDIRVRLNPATNVASHFQLPGTVGGPANWAFHPDPQIDLAVISINWDFLSQNDIHPHFFCNDTHAAPRQVLRDRQVAAGDGIFLLGFPMNLTGAQRNYVLIRQGCIARISEMLDNASAAFLVDVPAYPGNSGGPVILRPEMTAIEGTLTQPTAMLLGVVINYVSYNDVAVSPQTKQVRVIFQENSGLAHVLPVDYIEEAIAAYQAQFPQMPAAQPQALNT